MYNLSGHKVDTSENLKIVFFPTLLFVDKIYSRVRYSRYSDALLFINKLKDYLIGFSIDKPDFLNYMSKIENKIFLLSKKSIRNTEFFSQALSFTYFLLLTFEIGLLRFIII